MATLQDMTGKTGYPISSNATFGLHTATRERKPGILSTAANRIAGAACLALVSWTVYAAEQPPRILREPVLGLGYEIAKTKFDSLPTDILTRCNNLNNENITGQYWVFAFVKDDARSYYVVGGYGIHTRERPPGFSKYVRYNFGFVFYLEGDRCVDLGEARDVFDEGPVGDDMPQSILQRLTENLVLRLERGFGGQYRLQMELQKQLIDPDALSPELRAAFKSYFPPIDPRLLQP